MEDEIMPLGFFDIVELSERAHHTNKIDSV